MRQAALDGTTKKEIAYHPHGPLAQSQDHFLWLNITISINPGLPNLAIEVWNPDGPARTRGFSEQYFGPDVPEDVAREMMAFDDQVSAEDDALTDPGCQRKADSLWRECNWSSASRGWCSRHSPDVSSAARRLSTTTRSLETREDM